MPSTLCLPRAAGGLSASTIRASRHRVLSLKPHLRLEWRGQDGQNETEQPDHSASLGDSITASTRIRFSVHTRYRADRASSETFERHELSEIARAAARRPFLHFMGIRRP
jgi:hypothetical protein